MIKAPFAVILCQFKDVDPPSFPIDFNGLMSRLQEYWSQVSYGQCSLAGFEVFGWWTMQYSYIFQGTLPRSAWIAEAKRLAQLNSVDLSPFYGVIAVTNANGDDSESGRDIAVGIGGNWGQQGWSRCTKCQVLAYTGNVTLGACPEGDNHTPDSLANYSLALGQPDFQGQPDWRWCNKCQALNYAGNPPGPCPASGVHDYSQSGEYILGVGTVGYPGQNAWYWCYKCQGLVFTGLDENQNPVPAGQCAGDGVHDTAKSENYSLVANWSNWNLGFCAHESGHTLGLGHSWSSPVDNIFTGPEKEYGNRWDIMSFGQVYYCQEFYPPAGPGANAPNLDFLGWLPNYAVSTAAGTIRLHALNDPGLVLLAAKTTRAESTFYVEYRQATGWDQGFPRNAVFINEVRTWQWCNKCQALTFSGGSDPGPCPGGGVHDHLGSVFYTPLHKAPAGVTWPSQRGWQWCNKCQSLTYAPGGATTGVCQAGGAHDHTGSADYTLVHDIPGGWAQNNWRWCSKCQTLAYAGFSGGHCPAGGAHNQASYDYHLMNDTRHSFLLGDAAGTQDWQPGKVFVDKPRNLAVVVHSFDPSEPVANVSVSNLQNGWNWCSRCQGLFYTQNVSSSRCPAGGNHTVFWGIDLSLLHDLPGDAGQNLWRWCSKCQGLAYSGNSGGVCPAGGPHASQSYDYVLLHDMPMEDAQSNWRWCIKCQGLAFAGDASSGVCPADHQGHDLTHSADYNMINV